MQFSEYYDSGKQTKKPKITNLKGTITSQIIGSKLRYINRQNLNGFINTVYNNFIELAKYPELKHTPEELGRLMTSDNLVMYTITYNKMMIGYLIAEKMQLDDGRDVLFIAYLYVAKKYRSEGLGTVMLDKANGFAKANNLNALMLVCDTDDQKVMNFYFTKGFMYDLNLRRYNKYDVLTLNV